ncbi:MULTISPECIES: TonB-dependent receptor [Idiomarina]|uniref:TonB-dependent receptor n=2 Tax=Idiomarinaceae TaxID=267893 RepID=UPI000C52954F|nr:MULTISPECIES: TonB-dependent receptor [Idiomarina]MBP57487.1 TonB-dependent receptor [Idiomarina sp.]|tara:strand:- start:7469 stop:10039 length:2571 start_codon:yes stop_codon:yes gene_type:complete
MKTNFKYSLCALAIGAAFASPVSFAQDQENQAEDDALERIQVTGSRISRTDMEGASPVEVIDRESIEASGFNNLQQLLERLPSAGVGTFSTQGNSQDTTANGAAAISLRGFGADSTLVLLNGRRVAVSSFAEGVANSFVDINSIPVAAIERIDILKDGASAIYGSDAVAGVVNIILRDDFVGTELTASHGGTTGDANYEETSMSLVWGTGGDDSNTTMILDYWKNTSITGAEFGRNGTANQSPWGGNDFRSSRGFPGSFIVDGEEQPDPDCPEDSLVGTRCVFDYGPYAQIFPEAERVGAIIQSRKEFSRDVEGYIEVAAQHNRSKAGGAPTPLDADAGLYVPADHPNNPWGERVDINFFRTVDAGPRIWDVESDTLRFIAGLRGDLDGWVWDVSYQKGRSEGMQTGSREQGWVRTDFLQEQINAGNYNPFGGTINDPEVINDITTSLVRRGESHLTAVDASIAGEAFQLGEHWVSMAAGLEYREEDVFDQPDDQFQRGLIFGTESVQAEAERDQWAAYVEFLIPITDQLEATVAGRYDDYSDFGSTFNPQFKLQWRPTEDVTLRASYGEGFRAPSLAQIGLGPSQVSTFFIDEYRCETDGESCVPLDYTIVFSGSEDLQPEESSSYNIGGIWQVTDAFDISADYWSIEQDNKIVQNDFENVYNEHCNDQDSEVCERRDPLPGDELGELAVLYNTYVNLSSQEAAGVDFSANYNWQLQDIGDVRLGLDWSYMSKFEKDGIDYAGEYEYPEHRWTARAEWGRDALGVNLNLNYIGEFEDYQAPANVESSEARMVDKQLLVDLQAYYDVTSELRLTIGTTNLFDEEPPEAFNNDLYGYAPSVHNPRGRFVYSKVSYSF